MRARSSIASVSWIAYGRDASTRCWAFTMRDDAMSSIARVIFFVDWTDRIRRRTTRSWAPIYAVGARVASAALLACPRRSTEDMRSQPTSGFDLVGRGGRARAPPRSRGPAAVGANTSWNAAIAAFSVSSVSLGMSPVSRIADDDLGATGLEERRELLDESLRILDRESSM